MSQNTFKLSTYHDKQSINEYCENNNHSLNIMSLNAESIFSKIDRIRILVNTLQEKYNFCLHVLSIQEAWLTESKSLSALIIDNYRLIPQTNKIGGQKGGIVVYVHNLLQAKEI